MEDRIQKKTTLVATRSTSNIQYNRINELDLTPPFDPVYVVYVPPYTRRAVYMGIHTQDASYTRVYGRPGEGRGRLAVVEVVRCGVGCLCVSVCWGGCVCAVGWRGWGRAVGMGGCQGPGLPETRVYEDLQIYAGKHGPACSWG